MLGHELGSRWGLLTQVPPYIRAAEKEGQGFCFQEPLCLTSAFNFGLFRRGPPTSSQALHLFVSNCNKLHLGL